MHDALQLPQVLDNGLRKGEVDASRGHARVGAFWLRAVSCAGLFSTHMGPGDKGYDVARDSVRHLERLRGRVAEAFAYAGLEVIAHGQRVGKIGEEEGSDGFREVGEPLNLNHSGQVYLSGRREGHDQ